jgi:hypothetical protein
MLTQLFSLDVVPGNIAICQLKPRMSLPKWIDRATQFVCIVRTPDELSVFIDEKVVPLNVKAERGYRALKVKGPLSFDMIGVTATLVSPLTTAGVPIVPLASYNTDYLLVHSRNLAHACWALEAMGHTVNDDSKPKVVGAQAEYGWAAGHAFPSVIHPDRTA